MATLTKPTTTPEQWGPVLAALPPIFRETIDPGLHHRDMARPIVEGDKVYATNGHLLVSTPLTDEIRAAIEAMGADASHPKGATMSALLVAPDAPPVPLPDPRPGDPCDACEGVGSLPERECDGCDGEGGTECECCGHEKDCEECDGTGSLPAGKCPECKGVGHSYGDPCDRDRYGIDVATGLQLARHYVRMLRRHGVTEVRPGGPEAPVFFATGDFEGGLMPLSNRGQSK